MRDDSILESESGTATSKALARGAAKGVGALLSLAVMGGLVFWSYKLGTRDATDIPVIRAAAEATKMKPEEPGGLEVAHQGRAVYGVVSGMQPEAQEGYAPAEQELAAEDVAPVTRAPAPTPRPATKTARATEISGAARQTPAQPEPTEAAPVAEAEPVPAEQRPEPVRVAQASGEGQSFLLPRGIDPMALIRPGGAREQASQPKASQPEPAPTKTAAVPAEAAPEPEPAAPKPELVEGGPAPVAAPAARPRPIRTAAAAPAEQPEPRDAAAASSVQIQLGAFDSETTAIVQWAEIKSRNGDLLAGRGRVITPVSSGGRDLFRLRAGPFASIDEASTLCRGLKARGEACIVARAR